MESIGYKENRKIFGAIVRINRITKNKSQKQMSKGICAPSYLSRIESGELLPSEEMTSILLNYLGLEYNNDEKFISNGKKRIKDFFLALHYDEFDEVPKYFARIEEISEQLVASPLILEYYLCVLARYACSTQRDKFENTQQILLSSMDILSPKQIATYNYYLAVDCLHRQENVALGKECLLKSLKYQKNGHIYYWLCLVYQIEGNQIKAYESIKKALSLFVEEGNFISIMNSYEKIAEVYMILGNYADSLEYLDKALIMAKKLNNPFFINHIITVLAWCQFKLNDYKKSLKLIHSNEKVNDHRLNIPDIIIESLVYLTTKDFNNLKKKCKDLNSLYQIDHVSDNFAKGMIDLFVFVSNNEQYIDDVAFEHILLNAISSSVKYTELKKHLTLMLKEYYICHRKYKEALFIK
ncbi:MAG: helix-turn-helix domain-containing protein [Erysipelotrichaceae bacterium]